MSERSELRIHGLAASGEELIGAPPVNDGRCRTAMVRQ